MYISVTLKLGTNIGILDQLKFSYIAAVLLCLRIKQSKLFHSQIESQ